MSDNRQGGRNRNQKRDRRAFRPGLDGQADQALESRFMLSTASVSVQTLPLGPVPLGDTTQIQARVAFGGKVAKIRDTDLELYNVDLLGNGRVRAVPMSGGRVELIVDGSDASTVIGVNPVGRKFHKGTAHIFPPRAALGDNLLHIGEIKVTSGKIGEILANQTADLSGPIVVAGTAPVDRIALFALKPGASIITGGDLNTLDVFNNLSLGGSTGIVVGRDLNWMQVGGNITIGPGSTFTVNRDIGLILQPAKGSDPGGQGARIGGNMSIQPGGSFVVGRSVQSPFVIQGAGTGFSRAQVAFGGSNIIAIGRITG